MPDVRRLIMPERTMSCWLTTSASAGASLSVDKKKLETRMRRFLLNKKRNCTADADPRDQRQGSRVLDRPPARRSATALRGGSDDAGSVVQNGALLFCERLGLCALGGGVV